MKYIPPPHRGHHQHYDHHLIMDEGDGGRGKPERGSAAADLLGAGSPQENKGFVIVLVVIILVVIIIAIIIIVIITNDYNVSYFIIVLSLSMNDII